ncbi:MAG: hypothetical protein ACO3A2_06485 [Bdellovibrionia bacterium]
MKLIHQRNQWTQQKKENLHSTSPTLRWLAGVRTVVLGSLFNLPSALAKEVPVQSSLTFHAAQEVGRIEADGTLVFSPPEKESSFESLKTGIFEGKVLGSLKGSSEVPPYFLIEGKACDSCDEERQIFAIRSTGGKPEAFVYPGKIIDPKTRSLVFHSRAFFGKCLPHKGEVYVVFQEEKVDRRSSLQSSVLIAEPSKGYLATQLIEQRLPRLKTVLQSVKQKTCQEIAGRNRMMVAKLLNLAPALDNDNDDDSTETPN